jgi:anaerobic selenocysteine-containing dehydrogenase
MNKKEAAASASTQRNVHVVCPHDCPDTCSMQVRVQGEGAQARAVHVAGNPDHPFTQGVLCTKVARYLERTYAPNRVLYPMKRIGAKGPLRGGKDIAGNGVSGVWQRISWDEALDTIAARFHSVIREFGSQSVLPYSYAGTMGLVQYASMDRRFFHRMGASLLDRTICATAGGWGQKATLGAAIGADPEQVEHARLIIIWGSNPVTSNLHYWSRVQQAKRRGARLIAIDPFRSDSAMKCDQHIALLPGTDGALALGLMHVLIAENRIDRDYIERYTLGFAALAQRVRDYPPQRVAKLCGIDAAVIVQLARDYAAIGPATIRLNYGMQRHAGGGMAVRNICCLPALTGSWRDAAGGLLMSTSGAYPVDQRALERPDLLALSDAPRPRSINMSAIGDALLELRDPPVKAIYVYNSNPLAVAPDSSKVAAGFARRDLFCVVHDIFVTDTADYADILLPATTQLEQADIHRAYGHRYVQYSEQAIAPLGEAKPNSEVFRLLAQRMGYSDACLQESDEDIMRAAFKWDHAAMQGISFDSLKQHGWQRLQGAVAPYAEGGFQTPSGKCEFESAWLAAQGFDALPTYIPPHESVQSNAVLAERYPLAMISPPARHALNSSFANLPVFLEQEKMPCLALHPQDAAERGITEGSLLRVFNDRGSLRLHARISERARPGVVVALSLWWNKLSGDGANANMLTSQAVADFGGAATFYDCLVQVELLPMPLTA